MVYKVGVVLSLYREDIVKGNTPYLIIYNSRQISTKYFKLEGTYNNFGYRYDFRRVQDFDYFLTFDEVQLLFKGVTLRSVDKYLTNPDRVLMDINKLLLLDELEK